MAVANKQEGKKMKVIRDEEMKMVNGGLIVYAQGLPEFDQDCPWEVVENSTGRVLGMFPTQDAAYCDAKSYGDEYYNTYVVDTNTVMNLRNYNQQVYYPVYYPGC